MRFVMFVHSLLSDWNHGNAHFLRGIASELIDRGHEVRIYEPWNAWSLSNLLAEYGPDPIQRFHAAYPMLDSVRYDPRTIDLGATLNGADVVIVHEWNDPDVVRRIGLERARGGAFRLLFHDTHHRSVSAQGAIASMDLSHYDGVLAFGDVLRDLYRVNGWAARSWTWREAADTRIFHPIPDIEADTDVLWIGNWGDEERSREIYEFFIDPVRDLGVTARAYGVRYPGTALADLERTGIEFGGWLPNFDVPIAFARARITLHIPRRPYVDALPGVPTIRPFEAMACRIPLIVAGWEDTERLFTPGSDYISVRTGGEMAAAIADLLRDPERARSMAERARGTILARHTCRHRVDELLAIVQEILPEGAAGEDPVLTGAGGSPGKPDLP